MLVRDIRRITKLYLKSLQFKLDIISVLPFDLIISLIFRQSVPYMRFNRIIRYPRFSDFIDRTETRLQSDLSVIYYQQYFQIYSETILLIINEMILYLISKMPKFSGSDYRGLRSRHIFLLNLFSKLYVYFIYYLSHL